MKADPEYAKALFAQAHLALWQRDGVEPKPREVVIAAEKLQRAHLRRYGIDPKTLAKAAEITTEKTAPQKPGVAAKAANGKPKGAINGKAARVPDDDELRMPTREELLAEEWPS